LVKTIFKEDKPIIVPGIFKIQPPKGVKGLRAGPLWHAETPRQIGIKKRVDNWKNARLHVNCCSWRK